MILNVQRERSSERIRLEQTRLIYRNYPFTLSANFGMSLLVAGVLWHHVPLPLLFGYVLLNLALTASGTLGYLRHRKTLAAVEPDSATVACALRHFAVIACTTGCLWGATGMTPFLAHNSLTQELVFLAVIGLAFGGAAFLAMDTRVFYAYMLPMLLPTLFAYSFVPGEGHLPFAGFTLAAVFATSAFAHNVNALIMRSLQLRFENMDLIEALTQQKEAADYANLSKSRFLAAASHDLRQPVHTLGLFIDALSNRVHESASRKILDNITTTVETLDGMFNALLDVSKLDAGVLEPRLQDFPLAPLLSKIHNEFLIEAQNKGLCFTIRLTDLAVRSDMAMLERMLRNLVSNAIRYTESGDVTIGCRRLGLRVGIEVTDTGIGIAPSRHSEIFQEFYQAGNPERDRSKGVGLGLAIVRRLSNLLDHPVTLHSVPGKGSVFVIDMPAGDPLAVPAAAIPTVEIAVDRLQGLRIALVDDDQMVIESMCTVLSDWGCLLQHAGDGATLIEQLRESGQMPDVVISDYRLRGEETGAEVIRKVEEFVGRAIPAILITGDTAPDRLKESIATGFHLLHKPVRPGKLRALLAHLVAQRS